MIAVGAVAERLREVCERYGVARLEVFGSVSRGEAGPGSDIDLLYELEPGVRLGFRFFDLEDELADVFGRPVDLGLPGRDQQAPPRAGASRRPASLCGVSCCSCGR